MREEEFPQCGKTAHARAPPHETLQPTRKRKLEPSPQSTTPVYPRQSHEAPGMFPQVRTRHTPTAQRTRTDPTGQPFPQVTGSPTQPHAPPTATQRTHHHAKSNLGDEKKKGMRMRYPAVQLLFGPRLSRAGIVAPVSFPCPPSPACVYPVPAFSGLHRAGLTRPLYFPRAPYSWSSVKRISAMNTSGSSPVFSMPCR